MEQREESEACFDYLESRQRSTIGQGLARVDASFTSFLRAEEKERSLLLLFEKKN